MNRQRLFLTLIAAITISGVTVIGISSDLTSANSVDVERSSTIGYTLDIPEEKQIVKQGQSLVIPVKILTDTEEALNVKVSVTEFPEYPEGRASFDEQIFTNGISASLNTDSFQKSSGIIKDENVDVTFTASPTAELGERTLAITLLEGDYPNRSFVQTFVHVTIVE